MVSMNWCIILYDDKNDLKLEKCKYGKRDIFTRKTYHGAKQIIYHLKLKTKKGSLPPQVMVL